MIYWLLQKEVADMISGCDLTGIKATKAADTTSSVAAFNDDVDKMMSASSGVATIKVHGVLVSERSFFSMFGFPETAYPSLVKAIELACHDEEVSSIELDINSPGGEFFGMFDAIDAINNAKKPVTAKVTMAASAAYGIASATQKIAMASRASMVGSIGVVHTTRVSDSVVSITSRNAPNKRPDVKTKEGVDMVKDHLDELHSLFAGEIATGRNTTIDKVNADFGRGSMLLSKEALHVGMVDAIIDNTGSAVAVKPVRNPNTAGGETMMNLNKLRAEHPDLYNEVMSLGQKKEQVRVTGHIKLGVASGDVELAHKSIAEGSSVEDVSASYMAAAMSKNNIDQSDSDANDIPPLTPTQDPSDKAIAEQVVAAVEQLTGVNINA